MQKSLDPNLITEGSIVTLVINGIEQTVTAIEVSPHKIVFEKENGETFDVWKHYMN